MEKKRKRFRWLRRLLKRFRYRRVRAEDGKLVERTRDIEKWQEEQPLMRADYLGFRWKVLSRKRPYPSKNEPLTTPLKEIKSTKEIKDKGPEFINNKQTVPQVKKTRKQEAQKNKEKPKSEIHHLEDQLESLKLDKVEKGCKLQMEDGSEKEIIIYRAIASPSKESEHKVTFDVEDNDKNHMKVLDTHVEKKKKKKKKSSMEPCQTSCRYYSLLKDDVDEDDELPQEMKRPKKKHNRVVSIALSRGNTRNSLKHISAGLSRAAHMMVSSDEPCISQHGTYYGRFVPRHVMSRRRRLPYYVSK